MTPDSFHFLRPAWLLALVPVVAILWAALRLADRGNPWRGLVDNHLLRALVVDADGTTRRWPLGLAAAGWLVATLAMAGPTWERAPQPISDAVAPTVVVLDMSPSMQAEDLKPSRLARARFALEDVLTESAGGQVGLVLYSDEPYVASPLTDDPRVIEEMIPTLTPDLMPAPGSRADRAIALATQLLAQAHAVGGRIVFLSDGIDEEPEATRAAARDAAAASHVVSVIGIGTDEGAPARDGRGRMMRDADGRPMMVPLDQDGLEAVADAGGGRFARLGAGDTHVAGMLEAAEVSNDTRHEGATVQADVWRDMGIWLVLALVVLAPLGFRRGWLAVLLLALTVNSAEASTWTDLWSRPDQQGAAALHEGRADEAAELFADPSWKAAAQYQSGKFTEAAERYRGLADTESRYNLGNALARGGQLENALAAFDDVLKATPDHEDARFNRDLVQKLLDQQKEQQKQQQAGDSSQQQNGDDANGQQAEGDSGDGSETGEQQAEASGGEQTSPEQRSQQASEGSEQNEQQNAQGAADAQQGSAGEQQADPEQQQAAAGSPEQKAGEPADEQNRQQANAGAEQNDEAQDGQDEQTRSDAEQHGSDTAQADAGESKDQQASSDGSGNARADAQPRTRASGASGPGTPMTEEQQAREQMLRRIPDDPGGLLRAKIMRRYAEQRYATQGGFAR